MAEPQPSPDRKAAGDFGDGGDDIDDKRAGRGHRASGTQAEGRGRDGRLGWPDGTVHEFRTARLRRSQAARPNPAAATMIVKAAISNHPVHAAKDRPAPAKPSAVSAGAISRGAAQQAPHAAAATISFLRVFT